MSSTTCPICNLTVSLAELQAHVNNCIVSTVNENSNCVQTPGTAVPVDITNTPQADNTIYTIGAPCDEEFTVQDLLLMKNSIEDTMNILLGNLDNIDNTNFHQSAHSIYNSLLTTFQGAIKKLHFYMEYNTKTLLETKSLTIKDKEINIKSSFPDSYSSKDINDSSIEVKNSSNIEESNSLNESKNINISKVLTKKESQLEEDERLFQEFLLSERTCSLCKRTFDIESGSDKISLFEIGHCNHKICFDCMQNHCLKLQKLPQPLLHCPISRCTTDLPQWILKRILPPDAVEKLLNATVEQLVSCSDSLCKCPKCGYVFERVSSKTFSFSSKRDTDENGKPISKEATVHKSQFRYRCPKCTTIFCSGCKQVPYHIGYTCEGWKTYQLSRKCRFCQIVINASNMPTYNPKEPPGLVDICNNPECQGKKAKACGKILPCNHLCLGIKYENGCLPCLDSECAKGDLNNDDYCNICWAESLDAAPCIKLTCGHIFHYDCVCEKLRRKWPGARIVFGFIKCPLCKRVMDHYAIEPLMRPFKKLYDEISQKAHQRLIYEKLDKDPRLQEKGGKYFHDPVTFSLDKFAYYPCFKCKKPYFGGARACEEAARENAENFDPSQLVCGGCAGVGNSNKCPKHGKEYIEFKCKFCCNIATWFCWGTTHFCDGCHRKQAGGEYLTKKPRSQLPSCISADCPLRGKHPPNGEEFIIGCALCRK